MNTYSINPQIGNVKHSISFNKGIKKYKDGSDFFDIATFKNKKDLLKFEKELKKEGLTGR